MLDIGWGNWVRVFCWVRMHSRPTHRTFCIRFQHTCEFTCHTVNTFLNEPCKLGARFGSTVRKFGMVLTGLYKFAPYIFNARRCAHRGFSLGERFLFSFDCCSYFVYLEDFVLQRLLALRKLLNFGGERLAPFGSCCKLTVELFTFFLKFRQDRF